VAGDVADASEQPSVQCAPEPGAGRPYSGVAGNRERACGGRDPACQGGARPRVQEGCTRPRGARAGEQTVPVDTPSKLSVYPLNHSGNPRVNGVSHRGVRWERRWQEEVVDDLKLDGRRLLQTAISAGCTVAATDEESQLMDDAVRIPITDISQY
jgi:hypothetical protein